MLIRGPFVAIVFLCSIVGWAILLSVQHNNHARYFGCICIVVGGYNVSSDYMIWNIR
jgi:hypothetical protein